MSNAFDDVRAALDQAKFQIRAADSVTSNLAQLLVGRTRLITDYQGREALLALKRELADLNLQSKRWKKKS